MSKEVELLFALVKERYGARLTAEQLEEVRKGIEAVQRNARAVRAVALANSDEPMESFAPFRDDS